MNNGFKLTAQSVEEKLNYLNSQIGSTFKLEKRNTDNPSVVEYGVFCNGRLFKVGSLANIDSYIDGIYVGVGLPKTTVNSNTEHKKYDNYNAPSSMSNSGNRNNIVLSYLKSRQNSQHNNKFKVHGVKKSLDEFWSEDSIRYIIEIVDCSENHLIFNARVFAWSPKDTPIGNAYALSGLSMNLHSSMSMNDFAYAITRTCDAAYVEDEIVNAPNRGAYRYVLTITPDIPSKLGFSDRTVTTHSHAKIIT